MVVAEDSFSIFASLLFFPRTETVAASFFLFFLFFLFLHLGILSRVAGIPFVVLPQLFGLPDCFGTPGIGCPVVFEKFPSISTLVRAPCEL